MITFKEISNKIEQDSIIDSENLDTESISIPYKQSEYVILLSKEKQELNKIIEEYDEIRFKYYNLISGRGHPKDQMEVEYANINLKTQSEKNYYLDNLPVIKELTKRIKEKEIIIELIKSFISVLNQKSFQIKNAIEYLKFKNGLN